MTPKEALNTLDETVIRNLELKIVLSEAIKKQIPKKPIEKDWVAFDVLQERDWFCPDCDENMLSYGQPYCGVCGQAIDWS